MTQNTKKKNRTSLGCFLRPSMFRGGAVRAKDTMILHEMSVGIYISWHDCLQGAVSQGTLGRKMSVTQERRHDQNRDAP